MQNILKQSFDLSPAQDRKSCWLNPTNNSSQQCMVMVNSTVYVRSFFGFSAKHSPEVILIFSVNHAEVGVQQFVMLNQESANVTTRA